MHPRHPEHKVVKLLPDATIFRTVNDKNISDYINAINSNAPVGGNLKYSFERFNNTEFLDKFRNMRDLKDESTKSFVNTFIENIDDLKRFVMFMYQFLYYEILIDINKELTRPYKKDTDSVSYTLASLPLQQDEKIILYFKGGTTMYLIYDNFVSNIASEEQKAKINEQLKNKFSPSDTDMGIEIVCNTSKRFIIIKNALSSIITRCFDKIGYMFDFLLNKPITNATTLEDWISMCRSDEIIQGYLPDVNTPPNIVYTHVIEKIEDIIHEVQHCKVEIHKKPNNHELILDLYKKYIIKSDSNISVPNNPVVCGLLIELIEYISSLQNTELHTKIVKYKPYLENASKYILFQLYTSLYKMYSEENKKKYLDKLHSVFNSGELAFNTKVATKNIYHESFNGADKLIRRKQYEIPRDKINFSTRENFAISASDDPYYTGIVSSFEPHGHEGHKSRKSHYISVNNSILVDSNNIKIDFSLFRIKLLLEITDENAYEYINKLSHNLNEIHHTGRVKHVLIPSEILDVSIAGKSDTGHCIVINENNHLDEKKFKINDSLKLSLIIYSTKNHINDLNQILFKQCMFTPWLDVKYAKRIDRLVFFIMIYMHDKNLTNVPSYTKLLKLLKSVKKDIIITQKKSSIGNIKIYTCNKEIITDFCQQLLEYVNNKSDYNFITLSRKIKYVYTNVPYLYYDIYNLCPETDFNYFELLINCCLTWSCLLYTDTCSDNYIINSEDNQIEITSDTKIKLINTLHKKNAMYILTTARPDEIISNNIQKYLEFLYTVSSRIELLEPFFTDTPIKSVAEMNTSPISSNSIVMVPVAVNNRISPSRTQKRKRGYKSTGSANSSNASNASNY